MGQKQHANPTHIMREAFWNTLVIGCFCLAMMHLTLMQQQQAGAAFIPRSQWTPPPTPPSPPVPPLWSHSSRSMTSSLALQDKPAPELPAWDNLSSDSLRDRARWYNSTAVPSLFSGMWKVMHTDKSDFAYVSGIPCIGCSMSLHTTTGAPLLRMGREVNVLTMKRRGGEEKGSEPSSKSANPADIVPSTTEESAPTRGVVQIDIPPPDPERQAVSVPVNCLITREPRLRTERVVTWTVEVATQLLNTEHVGVAWLTLLGRTGSNFQDHSFDRMLGSMAMKVTPEMYLLFEAWLSPTHLLDMAPRLGSATYVKVRSREPVQPSTWYHLVGRSNGRRLQLFINGELAGESVTLPGLHALSVPPSPLHGQITLGCGMHNSTTTDPCSCLIAEARISPFERRPAEWLYTRSNTNKGARMCADGLKYLDGACVHGYGGRLGAGRV